MMRHILICNTAHTCWLEGDIKAVDSAGMTSQPQPFDASLNDLASEGINAHDTALIFEGTDRRRRPLCYQPNPPAAWYRREGRQRTSGQGQSDRHPVRNIRR